MNDIKHYDDLMHHYYESRGSNQKQTTWSEQVTGQLSKESRPHILPYLNKKGLTKR
jgi:nitroreductase